MLEKLFTATYPAQGPGKIRGSEEGMVRYALSHPSGYTVAQVRALIEWALANDLAKVLAELRLGPVEEERVALTLIRDGIAAAQAERALHRSRLAAGGRGAATQERTSGGFAYADLLRELTTHGRPGDDLAESVRVTLANVVHDPDGTAPPQDYREAVEWALAQEWTGDSIGHVRLREQSKPFRPFFEALAAAL